MLDFAWSEFALIGIVALLFIGPKDMPVAIRTVTNLLKKGRKLAGEFQSHVDEMVREVDLGEAQDQLKELRSFNVRGQLMRALDSDGSIKRTFEQKPLVATGLDQVAAGAPRIVTAHELPPPSTEPFRTSDVVMPSWHAPATARNEPEEDEDPERVAADPAPAILPPRTASRLRADRAKAPPPRFVPPRAPGRAAGPVPNGRGAGR